MDDHYDYRAVTAANATDDFCAMRGEVMLTLDTCGLPSDLPPEIIQAILQRGADKVAEAGGGLAESVSL